MITIELYRLNVSSVEFERIDTIHDAYNISWQKKLNDYGRASFSLNLFSIKAVKENLLRFRTQVVIKDNESIQWVGFISHVSAGIEGVNGTVNVECLEYFAHLASRYTDALKVYTSQPLEDIIWDLIDTVQSRENGELLITQGNSPSLGDAQNTYEYKSVAEAIIDYSDNLNGFDFDMSYTQDSASRLSGVVFNLYTTMGSTRNDLPPLTIGDNVSKCQIVTVGDIVNSGIIEGSGTINDIIVSTGENVGSQGGYTRREIVVARKDISDKSTLSEKIEAIINNSSVDRFEVFPTLKSGTDLSNGSLSIGDVVNIDISTTPASYLTHVGTARIGELNYAVDSVGVVEITPQLLFSI